MRAKFVIFSLYLRLWLKTIAWVSAEMSHRGTEWTKNFKTKQWKSRRHRRCVEERRKFTNFIRDSIPKVFISELIRNLYATSLLLFVPSAPP